MNGKKFNIFSKELQTLSLNAKFIFLLIFATWCCSTLTFCWITYREIIIWRLKQVIQCTFHISTFLTGLNTKVFWILLTIPSIRSLIMVQSVIVNHKFFFWIRIFISLPPPPPPPLLLLNCTPLRSLFVSLLPVPPNIC